MFSGICEAAGIIKHANFIHDCLHLSIFTPADFTDLKIGDSVAVNGVCLTITDTLPETFSVVIVPETLRLTTLQNIKANDLVNLERAVKLDTRIGGHYVQGHVDGRGEIIELQQDGVQALLATIRVDPTLTKYIIAKGYIAIDGMSITVINVARETFTVTFIPHTQAATIVHQYQQHQLVNIEVDILGKYIEKLLGANQHAISTIEG
jgi:riboflavin synthase